MSTRGLRIAAIGIGVVVFLLVYALNAGTSGSAFESGRQLGYAAGLGVIAGLIAYFVLRTLFRRRA